MKPASFKNSLSRKHNILGIIARLLGVFVVMLALTGVHASAKPNIILILADDLGYGDVGCYGATAVKTPNVDRLAAGGLRFTSAYSTAATCTPSRYSLMTGQYAFRQKGTGILPGDANLIIRPGRETLPSVLKRAGYKTAVVGKWHLGLGDDSRTLNWNQEIRPGPLEVGFDYSFITAATGDRVPCVYVENHRVVGLTTNDPIDVGYAKPFPGEPTGKSDRNQLVMDWSHGHDASIVNGISRIGYMKGGKSALWQDDEMAKVFVRQAREFIQREKGRPFFLYFATHDIHVPRAPNKDFVGKTTMGPRGDAITEFDWSVGQLIATLEDLKLMDNTLIVMSSDNGPVLDDGYKDNAVEKLGNHKPAGTFRAGKYSLFEGGTRMPFVTYWRGKIRPGVSDALISQADLLASFAALTDQKFDSLEAPDTQNQLAVLLGHSQTGRESLVEDASGLALREGDWKFIPPGKTRDKLGPWQTVLIPQPGFLFNLAVDPSETNDVAAKHPDKVRELSEALAKIRGRSELN
jgi:arylsulfatase A-like enzyme